MLLHLLLTCDSLTNTFIFPFTHTVWHCHILSHEDNEMMRPLCVYAPDDLDTLSNCCPDGQVYDSSYWDETSILESGPELRCIKGDSNPDPVDPCVDLDKTTCKKEDGCRWKGKKNKCVEKKVTPTVQAASMMDVQKVMPWTEQGQQQMSNTNL